MNRTPAVSAVPASIPDADRVFTSWGIVPKSPKSSLWPKRSRAVEGRIGIARLKHTLDGLDSERESYCQRWDDAKRRLAINRSHHGRKFSFSGELADEHRQLAEIEKVLASYNQKMGDPARIEACRLIATTFSSSIGMRAPPENSPICQSTRFKSSVGGPGAQHLTMRPLRPALIKQRAKFCVFVSPTASSGRATSALRARRARISRPGYAQFAPYLEAATVQILFPSTSRTQHTGSLVLRLNRLGSALFFPPTPNKTKATPGSVIVKPYFKFAVTISKLPSESVRIT